MYQLLKYEYMHVLNITAIGNLTELSTKKIVYKIKCTRATDIVHYLYSYFIHDICLIKKC